MIVDWRVHAGEAGCFQRYPAYADTFRRVGSVRPAVPIFKTMNQPLEDKRQVLGDLAVFIGPDLLPDWDFRPRARGPREGGQSHEA